MTKILFIIVLLIKSAFKLMQSFEQKIKNDFPWFKKNPNLIYLDSAATTLKPKCVIDKVVEYYESNTANSHNVDSAYSYKITKQIENSRKNIAKLINSSHDEIVFTSGATESISLIANGLKKIIKKNDEIILSFFEHASNIIPWQILSEQTGAKIIWIGKKFALNEEDVIKKISKRTKLISLASVSNILGYELNIEKILNSARKINNNIIFVVDATQEIPHRIINIRKTKIDFLAFSGHKILGPTGIGVCYINKKWIDKINPLRYGGGMNSTIKTDSFNYANGVEKFEGGTPHIAGIVGLNEAVNYLNKIGWNNIKKHEKKLKQYIDSKLTKINGVKYYSKNSNYPIIYFNFKNLNPHDLASYLWTKNIIVRSGVSCCKLSPIPTNVNGAVRASFYIYNTLNDVDALINALKTYKKGDELANVL